MGGGSPSARKGLTSFAKGSPRLPKGSLRSQRGRLRLPTAHFVRNGSLRSQCSRFARAAGRRCGIPHVRSRHNPRPDLCVLRHLQRRPTPIAKPTKPEFLSEPGQAEPRCEAAGAQARPHCEAAGRAPLRGRQAEPLRGRRPSLTARPQASRCEAAGRALCEPQASPLASPRRAPLRGPPGPSPLRGRQAEPALRAGGEPTKVAWPRTLRSTTPAPNTAPTASASPTP
jgi:hypothetical protein